MVGSVLLQPGKTDAGALFTSGVSSASMNPRGTASVLSKLTILTATVFMLSALLLSLPALTGNVSVLQTQGENAPAASDTNANANTADPNANSNADANTANSSDSSATNVETKEEEKTDDAKSDEKTAEKSDDKAAETKVEDKTEDKKE